MLPYPLLYDLVRERQRNLEIEAERSQLIKIAIQNGQVTRRLSPRAWLGQRLISWGTRLQADSLPVPFHGVRRLPYSG